MATYNFEFLRWTVFRIWSLYGKDNSQVSSNRKEMQIVKAFCLKTPLLVETLNLRASLQFDC